MRVLLYSKFGQYPRNLEQFVKKFNLEIVPNPPHPSNPPDLIITFGGDGTLLGAQRDFPEVPTLPIKDSGIGFHAVPKPIEETLRLFVENKLQIRQFFKLEVTFGNEAPSTLRSGYLLPALRRERNPSEAKYSSFSSAGLRPGYFAKGDKKFLALNEVSIRNFLPTSALRFSVESHPEQLAQQTVEGSPTILIGDGLIISTPFGSSGYFYSVTRKTFESGIGLAFNNIHNSNPQSQILDESAEIQVQISRGPAQITFDNNPEILTLDDNASLTIKKSPNIAKIFTLVE